MHEELSVRAGPDRGFPGMFDTELVRPGAFVANLPAGSIYYGVTRDLSVGTVLWSYLPLMRGLPGGSVHARYALGSTSWFRSTADVLFFGVKARFEDQGSYRALTLGLLGSNTEFVLNSSNRLTANAWLAQLNVPDADGSNGGATAFLFGGTYSLILARWAALNLTGLYLASGTAQAVTAGMGVDVDWTGAIRPSDRLVARGTVSLRTGSWLFNLGAARLGSTLAPWVNISFEVGG